MVGVEFLGRVIKMGKEMWEEYLEISVLRFVKLNWEVRSIYWRMRKGI